MDVAPYHDTPNPKCPKNCKKGVIRNADFTFKD